MSKQVQADTLHRDIAVNVQNITKNRKGSPDNTKSSHGGPDNSRRPDAAKNSKGHPDNSGRPDVAKTSNGRPDIAVDVRNITKNYEQWQRSTDRRAILRNLISPEKRLITALDDVSFQVEKGEFVAYAGANGAGKSTTMKILAGMLYPTAGTVSVLGLSPQTDRIPLMRRLGVMFGNRTELWWDQPVIQSFEWKRVIWDIPADRYRQTLNTVTELLDIKDLLHTFVRELSLGQRMKADLALLLLHEPELILLDEPTIGLDVLAKRQMIGFLKDLNRLKKTTILVTSHDMDDLEEMARRIILVSKGHIAYDGSFGDLRTAAGCMCRIAVTIDEGAAGRPAPIIPNSVLISGSRGVFEYEFDQQATPITSILSSISGIPGVKDVEIKKAPIEEVITGLYLKWKGIE